MAGEWWFPSLTVGVVGSALWVIGARAWAKQRGAGVVVVVVPVVAALLSLGAWSPVTTWLWEHVPPLTAMRFPERMWRYAALTSVPVVAAGLAAIRWPWARCVVVVVGVVEVTAQLPPPSVWDLEMAMRVPPELAPLVPEAARGAVRVAVDTRTDLRRRDRIDTRMWGLPLLAPPETTATPLLKFLPVEDVDEDGLRWLGVSHLIMPRGTPEAEASAHARLHLGPLVDLGDSGFALTTLPRSSPLHGVLLTDVRVQEALTSVSAPDDGPPRGDTVALKAALAQGVFFVDPRWSLDDDDRVSGLDPGLVASVRGGPSCARAAPVDLRVSSSIDRIEAAVESSCAAVLSVPWRFLPGWRAEVNGQAADVVAVNSFTLGVVVPPGASSVVFSWRPAAVGVVVVASWGLQGLVLLGALGAGVSRLRKVVRIRSGT
jgi:hypothetical protein